MKIFYICSSGDSTAYARAYLPGMALRKLGHEVNFNIEWKEHGFFDADELDFKSAPDKAAKNIELVMDADLIVMQRPGNITHLGEMFRLKKLGKPIVVEHDDLFTEIPEKSPFSVYDLDLESYNLCVMGADRVTTTTKYLRERLLEQNKKVSIVPNGLDLSRYVPKEKVDTGKFRIGLIGSASFADNQSVINLKEIASIPNVQIVVFGLPAKEDMEAALEKFKAVDAENIYKARIKQYKPYEGIENIEFHDYVSTAEYPDKLASLNLDLAIIPRDNSTFNRAKSNIKFIECAALKIPTVCQHFPSNDSPYDIDYQEDDSIMLLAGWGFPSFKEQIELLINDTDKKNQIAENAFQYIQRFDITKTVLEWEKVFKQVSGKTD